MKDFNQRYTDLINSIKGDKENNLRYCPYRNEWSFTAINNSICPLGEVEGEIEVSDKTLEGCICKAELAVKQYNDLKG